MSDVMSSIIEYSSDIADAEAPVALPANDYVCEIIEAENGTSKSSGKTRAAVTWRIPPEAFPADYEDLESFPEGKTVTSYVSSDDSKASRFRMRKFCEAIGAPMGDRLDTNGWVGKKALLSLEPDEYEGVERERVTRVSAI